MAKKVSPTWQHTIQYATISSLALTVTYAAIFVVYTIIRTSLTITNTLANDSNVFATLVANATSLVIASVTVTLLLIPFTVFLGIMTIIPIKWALQKTANHPVNHHKATFIGVITAALYLTILHLLIGQLSGQSATELGTSTYLFWIGLPSILYVTTAALAAWYINKQHTINSTQ